MTGYIFSSQADAIAFQAEVDAACGYPKQGRNAHTGELVPLPDGVTTHAHDVVAKPDGTAWAHLVSDEVRANAVAAAQAAGVTLPTETTLDSSWQPPHPSEVSQS